MNPAKSGFGAKVFTRQYLFWLSQSRTDSGTVVTAAVDGPAGGATPCPPEGGGGRGAPDSLCTSGAEREVCSVCSSCAEPCRTEPSVLLAGGRTEPAVRTEPALAEPAEPNRPNRTGRTGPNRPNRTEPAEPNRPNRTGLGRGSCPGGRGLVSTGFRPVLTGGEGFSVVNAGSPWWHWWHGMPTINGR